MTTTITPLALSEAKARLRAVWDLGDYPAIADRVIPHLGETLVEACGVAAPDRVLDVAAGAGNATLPAAARGAMVTASDLSDHLLTECARRAELAGLAIECVPGDAEALPFLDGEYDVVMSCVGVMFAPRHDLTASELARVCRPGGRIGVLSWTPSGFIGQLLAAVRPYAPPPTPGAQPPPLWGDPEHLESLFDGRLGDISFETGHVDVSFNAPQAFRSLFASKYGPTVAVYRNIDPARTSELDHAIDDLVTSFTDARGRMKWQYLLATGTRRH